MTENNKNSEMIGHERRQTIKRLVEQSKKAREEQELKKQSGEGTD